MGSLDSQTVELLGYTVNADDLAMVAAGICYDSAGSKEIVKFCKESGHESILEHNAFTFKIDTSRIISQQFTRHRIASFSQRSQRYCVEDAFSFYTPPEIKQDSDAYKAWIQFQKSVQDIYNMFVTDFNIKPEKARFVLTNATDTTFIMTMNGRELRHFFRLRLCRRAQQEIRYLAEYMLTLVKECAPLIFDDVDKPCLMLGYCDQGKMSCNIKPTLKEIKAKANMFDYLHNSGMLNNLFIYDMQIRLPKDRLVEEVELFNKSTDDKISVAFDGGEVTLLSERGIASGEEEPLTGLVSFDNIEEYATQTLVLFMEEIALNYKCNLVCIKIDEGKLKPIKIIGGKREECSLVLSYE